MRILVTRPQPDAETTAELLRSRGHNVTVCPLMEVVPDPAVKIPDIAQLQALLVTSANGIRAFAKACSVRDIRVLTVGSASAEVARNEGFMHVESANGDVESLVALVRQTLDPAGGELLHVAGSVTAGDLSGSLTSQGFKIDKLALYEAKTAQRMPKLIENGLQQREYDAVVLYSPRTANVFSDLVDRAGLQESLNHIVAFCLSTAVAEALISADFRDVRVSYTPDQTGMLALVDGAP